MCIDDNVRLAMLSIHNRCFRIEVCYICIEGCINSYWSVNFFFTCLFIFVNTYCLFIPLTPICGLFLIVCSNVFFAMVDDNSEIKSIRSDVDQKIAFLLVVVSIVFFRISNLVISKFIETPPRAANDPWRWRNLFVSWFHAILCGIWDIVW